MPTTAQPSTGEDTRERLLAAACRHFAERGFRGASVRDICTEAKANVASVSYYFRSKEGLYLEALRHSFRALHTPFQGLSEGANVLPALDEWIHASVKRNLSPSQPRWPAQLLWRELLDPTDAMSELVREVIAPELKQFQRLLQALAPSLTDEESALWSFTIMGQITLHNFARRPTLELMGKDEYTELDIARIAEHLTTVVVRGLGVEHDRAEG